MKFRAILIISAMMIPLKEYAQTQVNKTIPVKQGQTIVMHFDYPELVRVSTWDKNEISIQGTVSINGGENDDAFILENTASENTVRIRSEIKDLKRLPQRVTVIRDGQKISFKDKAEFKKYQDEHGKGYDIMNWGVDMEIQLDIKVPRNMETNVESVYGIVEVKGFNGPLNVEATYGGVDVAMSEKAVGELTAETNYGQIYSNLDIKFGENNVSTKDFYTHVSAKPGAGPRYNLESKYGNVYLRKASN